MIDKILSNISYLSDTEKMDIKDKLDLNIKKYIKDEYKKLFNEWHKNYSCFDIPSGIVSISINGKTDYISFGKTKYNKDTIFDVASMTKLYTEFIMFDVLSENNISLDTKIKDITSLYKRINNLTLMDLISFNNTYKTDIDMRKCTNKTDALNALRDVYIIESETNKFCYTDIPIMVLTDILEEYTHMSYKELFDKYIIKKYKLNDTYLELDTDENYVSINGKYVNDPKANIFGGYYGHAGVKASSKDMIKFLNVFFKTPYDKKLFTTPSNTIDNKCLEQKLNKALIGNINLVVPSLLHEKHLCLATDNIPNNSISIQGSVRCQGETSKFVIDGKEYIVSMCLFLDLYTQLNQAHNYEILKEKKITSEYTVDNVGKLNMVDIRDVLSYREIYKKLLNTTGIARIIKLNKMIGE